MTNKMVLTLPNGTTIDLPSDATLTISGEDVQEYCEEDATSLTIDMTIEVIRAGLFQNDTKSFVMKHSSPHISKVWFILYQFRPHSFIPEGIRSIRKYGFIHTCCKVRKNLLKLCHMSWDDICTQYAN